MIDVRPARASDVEAWVRMRCALWPDGTEAEHRREISQILAGELGESAVVLMAEDVGSGVVGFVELSIRPCAEGCRTNRIAYLEREVLPLERVL